MFELCIIKEEFSYGLSYVRYDTFNSLGEAKEIAEILEGDGYFVFVRRIGSIHMLYQTTVF